MAHHAEPVFEADVRARIQAEEVAGDIAEIVLPQVDSGEPVRQMEGAAVNFGQRSVVGRFTTEKSGSAGSARVGHRRPAAAARLADPQPAPSRRAFARARWWRRETKRGDEHR
jgi:hypothetical protein